MRGERLGGAVLVGPFLAGCLLALAPAAAPAFAESPATAAPAQEELVLAIFYVHLARPIRVRS